MRRELVKLCEYAMRVASICNCVFFERELMMKLREYVKKGRFMRLGSDRNWSKPVMVLRA